LIGIGFVATQNVTPQPGASGRAGRNDGVKVTPLMQRSVDLPASANIAAVIFILVTIVFSTQINSLHHTAAFVPPLTALAAAATLLIGAFALGGVSGALTGSLAIFGGICISREEVLVNVMAELPESILMFILPMPLWVAIGTRARGSEFALRATAVLTACALFLVGIIGSKYQLNTTAAELPKVYDGVLLGLDRATGLLNLSQLLFPIASSHFFQRAFYLLYGLFPDVGIPLAILEALGKGSKNGGILLQFVVASVVGYGLYCAVPTIGSVYFLQGSYPNDLTDAASIPRHLLATASLAPRNCWPSLHASWTILIALSFRGAPAWQRNLAWGMVAVMLVGTIGLGLHYVGDWIAALPFVVLVRALCAMELPPLHRTRLFVAGAATVVLFVWVVLLRTAPAFLFEPLVAWLIVLASSFITFAVGRRLARAIYSVGLSRPGLCALGPALLDRATPQLRQQP
jgi:hypothetical protein